MGGEKRRTNVERAGSLALDAGKDWAFGEGIDRVAGRFGMSLEVGGKTVLSRAASAPAQALVEIGKGVWRIGREDGRKRDADAGEELVREPLWYQAGNMFFSPAEALSQYGAAGERRFRKQFDEGARLDGGLAERVEGMNREVEERRQASMYERLGVNPALEESFGRREQLVVEEPDPLETAKSLIRRFRERYGI